MRTIRDWLHRLAGAFGTGRGDRDLAEELVYHFAASRSRTLIAAAGVLLAVGAIAG